MEKKRVLSSKICLNTN